MRAVSVKHLFDRKCTRNREVESVIPDHAVLDCPVVEIYGDAELRRKHSYTLSCLIMTVSFSELMLFDRSTTSLESATAASSPSKTTAICSSVNPRVSG